MAEAPNQGDGRTPLSQLLASMTTGDGGSQVQIPPDWLQGRAVYGGLSAALCLQSTLDIFGDDLPSLRSAVFSFIGPAGSAVEVQPSVARRGKSTAFINVDLISDDKLAMRGTLCFGRARDSKLAHVDLAPPATTPFADCGYFFEDRQGRNQGPNFAQHFNSRHAAGALPMSAADAPDFTVWLQHKDQTVPQPMVALAALADALPPAAMACFEQPAPISTMAWTFDVLSDNPHTENGWWLSRSQAEATRDGYSTQAMTLWNTAGAPVLIGRQNVAIFY